MTTLHNQEYLTWQKRKLRARQEWEARKATGPRPTIVKKEYRGTFSKQLKCVGNWHPQYRYISNKNHTGCGSYLQVEKEHLYSVEEQEPDEYDTLPFGVAFQCPACNEETLVKFPPKDIWYPSRQKYMVSIGKHYEAYR
jgi:hypothetical protein